MENNGNTKSIKNSKVYKDESKDNYNIYHSGQKGLPDDTLIFLDSGFLSNLPKYFGGGRYLVYDLIKLSHNMAEKEGLICKKIFYFTAPPFQSTPPTTEENNRRKREDNFISKLRDNLLIKVEEGRVQRIKDESGKYLFKQKGVDALAIMRLSFVPVDFPDIKKIILVSSDTDFCPVINELKSKGIEVILYFYNERKRNTTFSVSTELIKCCSNYVKLTKRDFEDAKLVKENKQND